MEKLKHMKEVLMCCVEREMDHLQNVDTKELGEVIDMIKDLEEAIYYNTVTEAMIHPQKYGWGEKNYYPMSYEPDWNNKWMDRENPMYSAEKPWKGHGDEMKTAEDYEKEGRAGKSRRQYMDSKAMHKDKAMQMRELEKYMQELSTDILEMIEDASIEEKQYLGKKVSGLAEKINKLN